MKITTVIRTFNRHEFLKEALVSIHLQSYKNWEVILFDDCGSIENFSIYHWFKSINPDKRICYFTTKTPYELFQSSWLLSPDIATGDILLRLDDDDILTPDCFQFVSEMYEKNPEIDFTYGSSVYFENNTLTELIETKNPFEHPPTTAAWAPYTLPNNKPWKDPWNFIPDYYKTPKLFTSIIHAAKANKLSVYHLYTMRTSSVKKVKDKITMTSFFVDDLEFFGSLDNLGLGHNSVKKILCFVRLHSTGKVSDANRTVGEQSMYQENFRIRDKVDELRPSGFLSKVIEIQSNSNFNNGIDQVLIANFQSLTTAIKSIINEI